MGFWLQPVMNRPLALLNSMRDDQMGELVDLVSLLRVLDLLREYDRRCLAHLPLPAFPSGPQLCSGLGGQQAQEFR